MRRPPRPPLAARLAIGLVVAAGVMAMAAALAALTGDGGVRTDALFWTLALCVVIAECLPVRISAHGEELSTASAFTLALAVTHGPLAALLVAVAASLATDVARRKPPVRAAYNAASYTLAWTAAGAVYGIAERAGADMLTGGHLGSWAAAGAALFGVTYLIALVPVAAMHPEGVRSFLRRHLLHDASSALVLMAFAPIVAVAADANTALVPLFALPLLAMWRGGREALRVEHQASHDALTGLPNRRAFGEAIEAALADARRTGTALAVLVMDLDRFKDINDTLGHDHGDELLRQVGPRLTALLREGDVVARLGGDEFGVLLGSIAGRQTAAGISRRIVEALDEPFLVDGLALEVGASVGIACAPEHGMDVTALIKRADVAMYEAKDRRTGHLAYDAGFDSHSTERLVLVTQLRRAITDGGLTLHHQPKLDLRTGRVVGTEALVRWAHPQRGMVPPMDFIPVAERTGLIRPLTAWVLDEALRSLAEWRAAGHDLTVAVNVSARSLLDARLPLEVAGRLALHRVPPSALELEITESTVMSDPDMTLRVLEGLADLGVRLSVDDFGTGYSSLAYLKRLPVSAIKIDRSFVMEMCEDASDRAIVASTAALARELGLDTVAEGVESPQALSELAGIGCTYAQGYHIARPMPAGELADWLFAREAAVAAAGAPQKR